MNIAEKVDLGNLIYKLLGEIEAELTKKTGKTKISNKAFITDILSERLSSNYCPLSALSTSAPQLSILEKVQEYIDNNNIFRVEFGHYDGIKWIPLKTIKVDIMEVLK